MFKCVPGPLKPLEERRQLIIEKLKTINDTEIIIELIEKDSIDNAIIKCDEINLDNFIINQIKRLK